MENKIKHKHVDVKYSTYHIYVVWNTKYKVHHIRSGAALEQDDNLRRWFFISISSQYYMKILENCATWSSADVDASFTIFCYRKCGEEHQRVMEMVSMNRRLCLGILSLWNTEVNLTWLDIITDYVKNLCSGEDGGLARCLASRPSKAQPSHQVPLDWLLKSHLDCNQYFS